MKLVDAEHIKNIVASTAKEPVRPAIHDGMPVEEIVAETAKACREQFLAMLDDAPAACDTRRIIEQLKTVNEDDDICEKLKQADRRRCKHSRGCFDCAITEAMAIVEARGIS